MSLVIATLIALNTIHLHGSMTLKAYNEYNQPVTTFYVGVPLTLEVALNDIPQVKERPTIQGLGGTYSRDTSMMTTIINGKVTVKFLYKVRFDSAGTYQVGPAMIEKEGKAYHSNDLSIKVIDQPPQGVQPQEHGQSAPLFVRMSVDKNTVMVGEKFKCVLRFYHTDLVTQVVPSNTMHIPGFVFEDGVRQPDGAETIKGVQYNYFEIQWNAYATQAGKKIIPAYAVDYVVTAPMYGNHISAIAMMFGQSFGERKRAYSNSVAITVDELPHHDGPVNAIGRFNSFKATIEPLIAKQGEGMVLALAVEGKGTFKNEYPIQLHNMSSSFKFYDSKQYDDASHTKKIFEFIVQGVEPGEQEIPRQIFTFYDTQTKSYKTLYTEPILVKIIPGASVQQATQALGPGEEASTIQDTIKPFFANNEKENNRWALPLWLFILCIVGSAGFVGYELMKNNVHVLSFFHKRSTTKNAFVQARKEIKNAVEHRAISRLLGVFVKLFSIRCSIDQALVDQYYMHTVLKKHGLQEQELEQWDQFCEQLNEFVFFNKDMKPKQEKALEQYAYRWIDRLEEIL